MKKPRLGAICWSAVVLSALTPGAAYPQAAPSPLLAQMASELAPQWWRWRTALPAIATPDKDIAGRFCDVGQSSKTWFLGGFLSFGSPTKPVQRTCVVPAGRRIFFPVITLSRFIHGDVTCSKAQAQVTAGIDKVEQLYATLDGADLLAADRTRWGSDGTCFRLNLPADGPSANLTAAADGYWMLIDPLPAGHHTLAYGGVFPRDDNGLDRYQATTYELDVK